MLVSFGATRQVGGPLGSRERAASLFRPDLRDRRPAFDRFGAPYKPYTRSRHPISVHNRYEPVVPPSAAVVKRFLPLAPLDFQVLTLLAGDALHGYGIVQASSQAFPGQPALDIGSLYRIIGRLLDESLIREVKPPPDAPTDRRVRRWYAVTELGRAVARADAARLRALLASPATLRLLGT